MEEVLISSIKTPIGNMRAHASNEVLLSLEFVEDAFDDGDTNEIIERLGVQLDEYFSDKRRQFDIPMAPSGTVFQKQIWSLLESIPFNRTLSYQQLSERYGDVKAIRAIASANGANPIAILIPCHRVIGSDGSLTGYGGGLWRKEYLLDLERGVKRLFDHKS